MKQPSHRRKRSLLSTSIGLLLLIPTLLAPSLLYAQGAPIVRGETAGGGLSGTYPNPTITSCRTAVFDNPATILCGGTGNEFCPGWVFASAVTITRVRYYIIGGTSIQFTAYSCPLLSSCITPTLSSQAFDGATLYTATTSLQQDTTPINTAVADGSELWFHIDVSTEIGSVTMLVVSICYTTP